MLIKIQDSKDGQFYFTINAGNGETIVTSETYTTKAKCVYAANLIKSGGHEIGDFTTRKAAIAKATKNENNI